MTNTHIDPSHLSQGHCVPCEGGTTPLSVAEEDAYRSSVEQWNLERDVEPHKLTRTITSKNFREVVALVNSIAQIAEEQGHHPDLNIFNYKNLTITLFTHAIGGLSMNDFIMAAKIDELVEKQTQQK